jgi:deoxycytidylate deaminase
MVRIMKPQNGPELVFGLIGPVGTNLVAICEALETCLKQARYESHTIQLSQLLHDLEPYKNLPGAPEVKRYESHMDAGNDFRSKTKRGDAMALLAVAKIRELRATKTGTTKAAASQQAYILRSLKHMKELEVLRAIYGKGFFLISGYAPRSQRVKTLAARFAKTEHESGATDKYRTDAERIIQRDEAERDKEFGQGVRDAFPLADYFVDASRDQHIEPMIKRFVDLVFGSPFLTPTRDESGMFHARAASLRSADLSRQVGAAITTADGEIIAVGCNDVPKPGGGQYWANDQDDSRDFKFGHDSSSVKKSEIISEILNRLHEHKILNQDIDKIKLQEIANSISSGRIDILYETQVTNLLEFGRVVHAEMAALADCSRRGVSVRENVMYSTTFPCHMCARHILASGISSLKYIEPYPKSLAHDLYPEAISVDTIDPKQDPGKLRLIPFVGVAPRRYFDLFEMTKSKNEKTILVKP